MSRLWTNELALHLRTHDCFAELLTPGWPRRVKASASATGRGPAAIQAALSALHLTETALLPAYTRLTVADEYVYYHLITDPRPEDAARREAERHFMQMLDRDDLCVQLSRLPGRRGWLAAAISKHDLQSWRRTLASAGLTLSHVHPALVEDLRQLSRQVTENAAVLVLLREQGAMMVRLEEGVLSELAWERFDPHDRLALNARLQAFIQNSDSSAREAGTGSLPVYIRPESAALCRYLWAAGQSGWSSSLVDDSEPFSSLVPEPPSAEPAAAARLLRHDTASLLTRTLNLLRPPPMPNPASLQLAPDSGHGSSVPHDRPSDPWLNTMPMPERPPAPHPERATEHSRARHPQDSRQQP